GPIHCHRHRRRACRAAGLRPSAAQDAGSHDPRRRSAAAVPRRRRGRPAGPDRHLLLSPAGEDPQRRATAAGLGLRALRRLGRAVGAGRRRGRGAAHAGGRGRAGRLLPLHRGRAPRLGGVPGGDAAAGQVADPDHPGPLGAGGHRRLPGRRGRPAGRL
ncbi:MAG: Pyridoxine 5'-phosphate oxidase, Rv1155, partial [uncultured Friedmanniella sp.]